MQLARDSGSGFQEVPRRRKRRVPFDKNICLDRKLRPWWNRPVNRAADVQTGPPAWDFVSEVTRAAALLHPLRLRILESLREPDSAAGLARRLRLPRQKVNYHVRELARSHFLERAGQRRRRNMIERRYRTSAQGYILSPDLLGRLGLPREKAEDAFSAAYLLGLMSLGQSELGRATREARKQGKRLSTLSLNSEIRFETPEQRARFAEELRRTVVEAVARHSSPYTEADGTAGRGRPYRLILGCYPIPPKLEEVKPAGGE
jgi:DNA-binding transcriptional ArsR family regulator